MLHLLADGQCASRVKNFCSSLSRGDREAANLMPPCSDAARSYCAWKAGSRRLWLLPPLQTHQDEGKKAPKHQRHTIKAEVLMSSSSAVVASETGRACPTPNAACTARTGDKRKVDASPSSANLFHLFFVSLNFLTPRFSSAGANCCSTACVA